METNKYNFIEQDPKRARVRLSHLKTCLTHDLPILESLYVARISEKQYYRLRKDPEVGQILAQR